MPDIIARGTDGANGFPGSGGQPGQPGQQGQLDLLNRDGRLVTLAFAGKRYYMTAV